MSDGSHDNPYAWQKPKDATVSLYQKDVAKFQKDCQHPPEHVTVDILEAGFSQLRIPWCRLCGAYKIQSGVTENQTSWRVPCAIPDKGG